MVPSAAVLPMLQRQTIPSGSGLLDNLLEFAGQVVHIAVAARSTLDVLLQDHDKAPGVCRSTKPGKVPPRAPR